MSRMWAGMKRWAINLLVVYLCFAGFGLVIGGLGGWLWHGHPAWTVPAAYAIAIIGGIVAAGMIRGYLPRLRARLDDRYDDFEIWLFDHPVVYVGMFAAIGLVSTWAFHELGAKLVGIASWTAIGFFNRHRWRKRVDAARAPR